MREQRYCEGCGATGFQLAEAFAVARLAGELEVAVWRCQGCGGLAEEEIPAPQLEALIDARVA